MKEYKLFSAEINTHKCMTKNVDFKMATNLRGKK